MIPVELIRACYRQLLGRDAEDDQVVQSKSELTSFDELLVHFLGSEEYKRRFPSQLWGGYFDGGRRVDVDVTGDQLSAMFERIRGQWSKLGESDPYWSVLTDEAYRGETLDDERAATFFETGAQTASAVEAFASRAGVKIHYGRCIELGCGVGRVTTHLAGKFEEVVAVDISPGNLDICVKASKARDIQNINPVLLRSPTDMSLLPEADLIFSTIVFQHNPPPVQRYMLDILLSKLRSGGAFLIQIPTHTPGYSFSAADYLVSPDTNMELHDLPMPEVFRLLEQHKVTPLEVATDGWTGLLGSHTFFGVKAG